MTKPSGFSEVLYRLLIRAYPSEFRTAFGDDLAQAFRDRRTEPRFRTIPFGSCRLWWFVVTDLVRSVAEQKRVVSKRYRSARGTGDAEPPKRKFLEPLVQDVRYGLRTFCRNPGFTAVAVAIVALGIGANTTMFTILSTLFLREPPVVATPSELVRFTRVYDSGGVDDWWPYAEYG